MSEIKTNVVTFPRTNARVLTEEEGDSRVDMMKYVFIDQVVETVVQTMAHQLAIAGYDILDDLVDFAFLIETVRSAMARTEGAYHPFQDLAEAAMMEPDEDGVMEIVDEIHVKFFQHEDTNEAPPAPSESGLPTEGPLPVPDL